MNVRLIFLLVPMLFLSLCFLLASETFAHAEEEMQVLLMFYDQKDLVVSSTRFPKPQSQVAENMTVVTADEIQAMNAHTVAEVLNRVDGLFVEFNQDFGAGSLIGIQGSDERHVRVLVDGVTWNFLSSGTAETNSIPVGIIERIEIIKGPASSSWGSSLGGVVNIITKAPGIQTRPSGSVSTSYGERRTQDYSGQVKGSAGPVGYYLYGGYRKSDGQESARGFEAESFYSKFRLPLGENARAELAMGYGEPDLKVGNYDLYGTRSSADARVFWSALNVNGSMGRYWAFELSARSFSQKLVQDNRFLGLPEGMDDRYLESDYDEDTHGGSGKLIWRRAAHTVVLGMDLDHGELDQTLTAGPLIRMYGVPARIHATPDIDKWAVYLNDSFVWGDWTITPGIRYDDNDITDGFVSPSLGVAYHMREDTILRASASRGFTIPSLSSLSGGGFQLDPNPDLDPETVDSLQIGAETRCLKYASLKATLFRHVVDDTLTGKTVVGADGSITAVVVNGGTVRRKGAELMVQTIPLYDFSLQAGATFVDFSEPTDSGARNIYAYNIGLRYDNPDILWAELFGHYVDWDIDEAFQVEYDDVIWDLNLRKSIYSSADTRVETFFTAHNLFDGMQYLTSGQENPGRWLEAGFRVMF